MNEDYQVTDDEKAQRWIFHGGIWRKVGERDVGPISCKFRKAVELMRRSAIQIGQNAKDIDFSKFSTRED